MVIGQEAATRARAPASPNRMIPSAQRLCISAGPRSSGRSTLARRGGRSVSASGRLRRPVHADEERSYVRRQALGCFHLAHYPQGCWSCASDAGVLTSLEQDQQVYVALESLFPLA